MVEQYIGIENELITFKKGRVVRFNDYFESFAKDTDYSRASESIRTPKGLGFYVDGGEIEILTPPVAINNGFATRLTDLLMIGRDRVINSFPELEHTGFSMHWNLTDTRNVNMDSYLSGIAVPFHLFGLTPLSVGLNLRSKDENPRRYELLGDSLTNEEQIKANALLLGAYSQARSQGHAPPFLPEAIDLKNTLFLPDGRYDEVRIVHPPRSGDSDIKKTISAQQYLELFYHWLEPFVKDLGTRGEINNLEGFVSGDKNLEFDNFKYFAFIKDQEGKKGGMYLPIRTCNKNFPGQILMASGKKRKTPLEGRLLGEYIKKMKDKIESMTWEKIDFYEGHEPSSLSGIERIYNHVRTLNPNLPDYNGANNSEQITPNSIDEIKASEPLRYDSSKDNFIDKKKGKIMRYFKQEVKRRRENFYINIALGALVGLLIGMIGSCIYDHFEESSQVNSVIEQHEQINTGDK